MKTELCFRLTRRPDDASRYAYLSAFLACGLSDPPKHLIRRSRLLSRTVSEMFVGDEDGARRRLGLGQSKHCSLRYNRSNRDPDLWHSGSVQRRRAYFYMDRPGVSSLSLSLSLLCVLVSRLSSRECIDLRGREWNREFTKSVPRVRFARGLFIASFVAEGLVKGRGYIYLVASGCGTLEIHPLPCLRRPNGGRIFMSTLNERRMYL